MKEKDYIDATDLAKARIALAALEDTVPRVNSERDARRLAAIVSATQYVMLLERAVSSEEEE